jgi:deoxyribodipyrimidine photo-lyase
MADRSDAPCILWCRDDLRLSDHPALHAAASTGRPVICVYVFDETLRQRGARPIGGAARWWLAQSLRALHKDLSALGVPLSLRKGPTAKIIPELARESGAGDVFWNTIAQAPHLATERDLTTALRDLGIEAQAFVGDLLATPENVRTKEGRGLRVFTPFWRRIQAMGAPPNPLPAPTHLRTGPSLTSEPIESLRLEPTRPDWAGGLRETWTPGESAGQKRLKDFLSHHLSGYTGHRDRPDLDTRNLQSSFDAFPWRHDEVALTAWQRGQTGYPIVDAGMRQLWHTGVMHNRVRLVVASFLVKHLLIDWREGEKWFWDTLVDADAGSNPANWQWVAGSGADAAPYFRVFNPVLPGEKFDPDGSYVRRWVPELAELPKKPIHQPWEAAPLELASAGITLGKTYPQPIVDHRKGRERALKAYEKIRGR